MLFERRTCALAMAVVVAGSVAAARGARAAEEGDRATVTVRLGATYRSGAAMFGKAGGGEPASIGETQSVTLKAAFPPAGGGLVVSASDNTGTITTTPPPARGGVVGGVVAGAPGAPPPAPGVSGGMLGGSPAGEYVWNVQVRLVSVAANTVTFNVAWSRTDETGRVDGDARTVRLGPDEHHFLDFVPTDNKDVANLFIEVTAMRVENPAYANLAISYDLWLVHETAAGQKITRRVTVAGGQGDGVKFTFNPILFPIDAKQPIDGSKGPIRMLVRGMITGRARGDGTIELVVRTERTVGPTARQDRRSPGEIGGGEKVIVVRSDETTMIELPPGEAWFSFPLDGEKPSALRPGAEFAPNGSLRVTQRQFMAGSKTSLLITLRGGYGGIVR